MTSMPPDHVRELVEIRAGICREAEINDRWLKHEATKVVLWLATDTQAEFDEAVRIYLELSGL